MVFGLGKDGAAVQFADEHHASDEILEQYAMDRLTGTQLAAFEEHLLVCEFCQKRLAAEDSARQGFRDGGAAIALAPSTAPGQHRKLLWSIGLAAAVLLVLAVGQLRISRLPAPPPATILLQAMRGADGQSKVAPAGKPLTLLLDLTDLPQLSAWQLEIVDSAGRPVLESNGVPHGNRLQVAIAKGPPSGAYFVRLYDSSRELSREYALSVR